MNEEDTQDAKANPDEAVVLKSISLIKSAQSRLDGEIERIGNRLSLVLRPPESQNEAQDKNTELVSVKSKSELVMELETIAASLHNSARQLAEYTYRCDL